MHKSMSSFFSSQEELEKSRHELEDMDLTVAQLKAVSQRDCGQNLIQKIVLSQPLFEVEG